GRGDRHLLIERLVRAVGVVLLDPGIDRGLRLRHGSERAGQVEEVRAEGAVEAFYLPVLVRCGRGGQPVGDAVVAADLVEQHLAVAGAVLAETISELLAVEFLSGVKCFGWWS